MIFWLFLWMTQRLDYQLMLVRNMPLSSIFLTLFITLKFICWSQFVQRHHRIWQDLMNLLPCLKQALFKLGNSKDYFMMRWIPQNIRYTLLKNSIQGIPFTRVPSTITPLHSLSSLFLIDDQTLHFNNCHYELNSNNRISVLILATEPVTQTFSPLIFNIQKSSIKIGQHLTKNAHKNDVLATRMDSSMLPLNLQNAFYVRSERENIRLKVHHDIHGLKRKIQGIGIEISPIRLNGERFSFFASARGNHWQKRTEKAVGLDLSFGKNIVKPNGIEVDNDCQKSGLLTVTLPETQYAQVAYSS